MKNKFNIGDFVYAVDCDKEIIKSGEIIRILITRDNIYYDVLFTSNFGKTDERISEEYIAKTSDECLEIAKKCLLEQIKDFKILD